MRIDSLPPFAMWPAFPTSDYYEGSAPTGSPPPSPWVARFLDGRNPVSSHVPVSNLRIVRRHALPLAAQDDGNWEMSIIKCDDRTSERATLRPARSHRIALHAIPSLRVVSCKYRGFLRMLRCLAIDSAVARPVVNGPRPVQFRPLC